MPKLVQLNVTANWGSTGTIAEGIGKSAQERGWDSIIAFGRMSRASASMLIKVGFKLNIYLHYAKDILFDGEGLGSKNSTLRLVRELQDLRPDIIHFHNIHDHWLNYPILFEYLASSKTPVVWTFHDCWAFTGGCYHFENSGCFKWRNEDGCKACESKRIPVLLNPKRNFSLKKKYISSILPNLTVVGVSQWMADFVKESFIGKGDARIEVINNGIDINTNFIMGRIKKEKMILGVSNVWTSDKGLDDFIKLRSILPRDIGITLIGLNSRQISSLPEGVKGFERTANVMELAKYYQRASVFVNPTYNDSFPTVNLEALACGTPVVTYRTGGSPEAVDENTGIIVEKGDVVGLSNAIKKVLDCKDRFTPHQCRTRAETHFDARKQFDKYIDLYETLLNDKK